MSKFVLRGGWFALVLGLAVLSISCGDLYRPIANPVIPPSGDPEAQRQALIVSFNDGGQGSAMHVSTSGDTLVVARNVGAGPVHGALSPQLNAVYIANRESDNISFYNPLAATTNVDTASLPAGSAPSFVLYTDGTALWVANTGGNTVGVLNPSLRSFTDLIPVGPGPVALADTPNHNKIFTANSTGDSLSVINVADKTVTATVAVGTHPVWLAMTGEGRLFVVNEGSGTVSVVDTTNDTVTDTITVGASPRMAAYDARLRRLYVVNSGSNSVTVVNADTLAVLATLELGAGANPSCVTPLADGSRFYVANAGLGNVSVVDASSFRIRKTIEVGENPVWIDSAGDSTKVFVANRDSNTVSDIRTLDDTVVATLNSTSPQPVFVQVQPR